MLFLKSFSPDSGSEEEIKLFHLIKQCIKHEIFEKQNNKKNDEIYLILL